MSARARNLLMVSASLLISAVLLEVGYRFARSLLDPEPIVPPEVGEFSTVLGWALRPGASASSSRTGRPITYRINSLGLRDDETHHAKPPGTYRIVLLGDSRTFGYGVPIEQHFSRLLEAYFERLEVINMGVSGFGVDQELLFLREEGFRYQPDLVMAYVAHFGDHRHMSAKRWGQPKPRFLLQGGELVLTNSPVPTAYEGMDLPHRIDWFLTHHSPIYRDLAHSLVLVLKRGAGAPQPGPDQTQADEEAARDPEFMERLHEVAAAILQQMDRESAAHRARFVLVTQVGRLYADCPRLGLTCLDVSEPLSNALFELSDGLQHVNESGNGVLAWEIAEFLRQGGLVPDRHWKAPRAAGPHF